MTRDWIDDAGATLAAAVGEDAAAYMLTQGEIDAVLELARHAAHESGVRSNAPLLCYLAGVARVRHPERPLARLVEAVTQPAGEVTVGE